MSDETTLLLRKLLDERGVEYEAYRDIKNRCITKWRTYHGAFVFFAVEKEGKLFVETASDTEHSAICTPEQAIAATLGSDRESELQSALNKAAGNWAKADALLRERTSGTLTAEQVEIAINNHCQFTVGCVVDAQAIADELNARAERTCHIIEYDEVPYPVCSECGAVQPDDYTVYFCWSCGAKVRDE